MSIQIFGDNLTLKSFASKDMQFDTGAMGTSSAVYSKMYKRSMFNISGNIQGFNGLFSSCYAPNVFNVTCTLNGEGIAGGINSDFLVNEFYKTVEIFINKKSIQGILNPQRITLISSTRSSDEDGFTQIVKTDGTTEKYKKISFNYSNTYKVYFPSTISSGVGGTNDVNLDNIYSLSVSCQDKTYTIKAASIG